MLMYIICKESSPPKVDGCLRQNDVVVILSMEINIDHGMVFLIWIFQLQCSTSFALRKESVHYMPLGIRPFGMFYYFFSSGCMYVSVACTGIKVEHLTHTHTLICSLTNFADGFKWVISSSTCIRSVSGIYGGLVILESQFFLFFQIQFFFCCWFGNIIARHL